MSFLAENQKVVLDLQVSLDLQYKTTTKKKW